MEQTVTLLKVSVHVQHQLVTLGPHVDKFLVEGVLKLVDAVGVGLDAGSGETMTGLYWRYLVEQRQHYKDPKTQPYEDKRLYQDTSL